MYILICMHVGKYYYCYRYWKILKHRWCRTCYVVYPFGAPKPVSMYRSCYCCGWWCLSTFNGSRHKSLYNYFLFVVVLHAHTFEDTANICLAYLPSIGVHKNIPINAKCSHIHTYVFVLYIKSNRRNYIHTYVHTYIRTFIFYLVLVFVVQVMAIDTPISHSVVSTHTRMYRERAEVCGKVCRNSGALSIKWWMLL